MNATLIDDRAKLVYEAVDQIAGITDALERAQAATALLYAVASASEELRDLRHLAVVSLKDERGWGYQHIGDQLGVGKARASQIYAGSSVAKRPGVIEVETKVAAAEMRGSGATDLQLVTALVPKIRAYKGGVDLSVDRIAEMLDLDPVWLGENIPKPVEKTSAK